MYPGLRLSIIVATSSSSSEFDDSFCELLGGRGGEMSRESCVVGTIPRGMSCLSNCWWKVRESIGTGWDGMKCPRMGCLF